MREGYGIDESVCVYMCMFIYIYIYIYIIVLQYKYNDVIYRSYKGSHLALMIELIAGALTGASMQDKKQSKNWGTLVLAIDPAEFTSLEEFQRSAGIMCDRVKHAKKLSGVHDICLPGERGDAVEQTNKSLGTIELNISVFEKLSNMTVETSA